jgi:DnaJ-class molecular chaperone
MQRPKRSKKTNLASKVGEAVDAIKEAADTYRRTMKIFEEIKQAIEQQPAQGIEMLEGMTPYEFLGVSPDATEDEVKSRYRVLMKIYHTDVGGSDMMAKRINAAYGEIKKQRGWK